MSRTSTPHRISRADATEQLRDTLRVQGEMSTTSIGAHTGLGPDLVRSIVTELVNWGDLERRQAGRQWLVRLPGQLPGPSVTQVLGWCSSAGVTAEVVMWRGARRVRAWSPLAGRPIPEVHGGQRYDHHRWVWLDRQSDVDAYVGDRELVA